MPRHLEARRSVHSLPSAAALLRAARLPQWLVHASARRARVGQVTGQIQTLLGDAMEQLLGMLPKRPQPALIRYGVTATLVVVCFIVLVALRDKSGAIGFYVLLPAIFAASVLFDRGAGIFATALCVALLYLLMRPGGMLPLAGGLLLQLLVFVFVSLGLALVSDGLRTAGERAADAERTKDLLLRELGHRTMNNLAMVISVLSLQARGKANPETRYALEKAVARVRAIASAHEHFNPLAQNGRVEMRPYLERLCGHLGDALRDVRPVAVQVVAQDVLLPTQQAIAFGLIVNELVTNALKHAFPDNRSGTVRVVLEGTSPLVLVVEDNGVGLSAERREGLGSRLTRLLAEQLGATATWENANPGARVRIAVSSEPTQA
jgi:two-component sensor histidine kinase